MANAFGYIIGFFISFILNKKWTFSFSNQHPWIACKYFFVAISSYLLNLLFLLCAEKYITNPYMIQFFAVVIYSSIMFVGCRFLVFKL